MCGFKISDTVIREERIEKRKSRAEPWDAPAERRRRKQQSINNIKE